MIKIVISFFFSFLIFTQFLLAQNENSENLISHRCDSISKKKFDRLVGKNLKKMRKKKSFNLNELITIIKIEMSVPISNYNDAKGRYKKFIDLYNTKLVGIICNTIECVPLKGLILYSKEYHMYITIPVNKSEMPCYNFYFIKKAI